MKVLLLKDVYKLGRAGDVKKVADGYGRNYLIPQGLAMPATQGSLKLADSISKKAAEQRAILTHELQGVADILNGLVLDFAAKAGETGKLYGSVTSQMVADKVKEVKEIEIDRRQIVMEPLRAVGEYDIPVHLTLDLMPELKVVVRREGEVARPRSLPVAEEVAEEVVDVVDEITVEEIDVVEVDETPAEEA